MNETVRYLEGENCWSHGDSRLVVGKDGRFDNAIELHIVYDIGIAIRRDIKPIESIVEGSKWRAHWR